MKGPFYTQVSRFEKDESRQLRHWYVEFGINLTYQKTKYLKTRADCEENDMINLE